MKSKVTIIEEEIADDIKASLKKMESMIKLKSINHENIILVDDEIMKLLKISNSTLKKLRSDHKIKYSKIGKKYYYKYSDLLLMIKENEVKKN